MKYIVSNNAGAIDNMDVEVTSLKITIKRGELKDGKFNENNTINYSDVNIATAVDMLDEIANNIDKGIYLQGTEVRAITIQSWTNIIKSAADVREMANYYRKFI